MPLSAPDTLIEVAAAVILRPNGEFLLAQRPAGKVYAGYWEFPGGKAEPSEPAHEALKRELREELGIEVIQAWPWIVREYLYAHAHVRLNFFRVVTWGGEASSREAQTLSWQRVDGVSVTPLLPANGPILRALALPPIIAITDAAQRGIDPLLERLDARLASGLRMVMVREKQMARHELNVLLREVLSRCRRFGALVIVNGDQALASEAGADGVHWTSGQLMDSSARPDVPWCGASCHSASEMRRAAELELDYVILGPVLDTPSHPGTPRLGWERFAQLVGGYPLPVYAVGGMALDHLGRARTKGAQGVAMIRGAWNSPIGQSFPSAWSGSGSDGVVGIR